MLILNFTIGTLRVLCNENRSEATDKGEVHCLKKMKRAKKIMNLSVGTRTPFC